MDCLLVAMSTYWSSQTTSPDMLSQPGTDRRKPIPDSYCRFASPSRLHSGHGRNLKSEAIEELCSIANVEKSKTTLYHLICN